MTTGKSACGELPRADVGCLGFGDVTRPILARAISRSSQTMSKNSFQLPVSSYQPTGAPLPRRASELRFLSGKLGAGNWKLFSIEYPANGSLFVPLVHR